jgi:hypothetical protein
MGIDVHSPNNGELAEDVRGKHSPYFQGQP